MLEIDGDIFAVHECLKYRSKNINLKNRFASINLKYRSENINLKNRSASINLKYQSGNIN